MWANHDWTDIHPAKISGVGTHARVLYPGGVSPATFRSLATRVVDRYFTHPSYWLLNGCPYFSVYDLNQLIHGLGGLEATAEALAWLRERTKAAGFPDLHLNAVVWNRTLLPGETIPRDPDEMLQKIGFDSFSSYVWVHHVALAPFPEMPYVRARQEYFDYWQSIERQIRLPYIPNVTMGWDPSPRTVQSDRYVNAGYPFTPILSENTPEQFEVALQAAKERLMLRRDDPKILTINAWNEWTEGSYLEPDTETGLAYLQAVKRVLG
jgi:hypothetical protein